MERLIVEKTVYKMSEINVSLLSFCLLGLCRVINEPLVPRLIFRRFLLRVRTEGLG